MKLSISQILDAGQAIQAFSQAGVKGIDDFVTYLSDFSKQILQAVRNNLTLEDNLNTTVKTLSLKHDVVQLVSVPSDKKTPVRHIMVTRTLAFENPVESFAWEYNEKGQLRVRAAFRGSPTGLIDVVVVMYY